MFISTSLKVALHRAADNGVIGGVKDLLRAALGYALLEACRRGDYPFARMLMQAGVGVGNIRDCLRRWAVHNEGID